VISVSKFLPFPLVLRGSWTNSPPTARAGDLDFPDRFFLLSGLGVLDFFVLDSVFPSCCLRASAGP
jgi:hypothetical protein